jgi:NADH dehydrogenase [ubiquinone] 1 alpha subcomplex assembly factor 5
MKFSASRVHVNVASFLRAQRQARRSYAFQAPGAPIFEVFNRRTKWLQRERAAANVQASRNADYLRDEVATRLCERLLVCCLAFNNDLSLISRD